MKALRVNYFLAAFLTALALFLVLMPYSLFIGWNLITAVLFWFVLVPVISYLCSKIFVSSRRLVSAISGSLLFYAFTILMIYKHYKSDQFTVMVYGIIPATLLIVLLHASFKKRNAESS